MKIIRPEVEFLTPLNRTLYEIIERAGRTCYRSEDSIKEDSAPTFVAKMIDSGHEAMIEHATVSVAITCDRGVSHEIVRHRIASYAQESTRYCNYSKDKFRHSITYIDLYEGLKLDKKKYTAEQIDDIMAEWVDACADAENHYFKMLDLGATPQMARSVLNNSTKTAIIVTMNLREWRHFLKLRCAADAHPQMREIAYKILTGFRENLPIIVSDISYEVSK